MNEEKQYNECIKCEAKEFTTQESNKLHICDSCCKEHADEENAEYAADLEAGLI